MPIHRLPRATMHEDVHAIEHDGERITALTCDADPAYVLVATCYLGERIETRPAVGAFGRIGGAA